MKQTVIGFLFVLCLGCVPDQLAEAGKCFSHENYTGAVRELDKYLNNVDFAKTLSSEDDAFHQAAAYFYRGLSKRAAMIAKAADPPSDYRVSGHFRYRTLQAVNYTSLEIINDYEIALLKKQLSGVSFHMGLELFLSNREAEGSTWLSRFLTEANDECAREKAQRLFGAEVPLSRYVAFAEKMVRTASQTNQCSTTKQRVASFYRSIFFRKSAGHELHNARLLMKKYAVRRFGFLKRCLPEGQTYDYLSREVECGTDFLILRGTTLGTECELLELFNAEGFETARSLDDSTGISLTSRMHLKIFEGEKNLPVLLCVKKADFGNVLVAIYSKSHHTLYCLVLTKKMWATCPVRSLLGNTPR